MFYLFLPNSPSTSFISFWIELNTHRTQCDFRFLCLAIYCVKNGDCIVSRNVRTGTKHEASKFPHLVGENPRMRTTSDPFQNLSLFLWISHIVTYRNPVWLRAAPSKGSITQIYAGKRKQNQLPESSALIM